MIMRKIILFIVLSLFSFTLNAQESEKLSFVEIVPVEGVSSDELYNRAEIWIATAFRNPDKVTKYRNAENHQIILMPRLNFQYSKTVGKAAASGTIEYTMKINTRDGRYRVEVTDCYHNASSGFGLLTVDTVLTKCRLKLTTLKWEQQVWNEVQAAINREVLLLFNTLKQNMVIIDAGQSEDW